MLTLSEFRFNVVCHSSTVHCLCVSVATIEMWHELAKKCALNLLLIACHHRPDLVGVVAVVAVHAHVQLSWRAGGQASERLNAIGR